MCDVIASYPVDNLAQKELWSSYFVGEQEALTCINECQAVPQRQGEHAQTQMRPSLGICLFLDWISLVMQGKVGK